MLKIGTHNGKFHADEVLACFFLKCLPEYQNSVITRTRDGAILDTLDILVDVGGVYDFNSKRFDHHQKSFVECFSSFYDIKLSSAGLIYKHFGKSVITAILKEKIYESDLDSVYEKMYRDYVLTFDAVDNGVPQYPSSIKPKYRNPTDIFSQVNRLNPSWNSANKDYDGAFFAAIELVGKDFIQVLVDTVESWIPAKNIVDQSIQASSSYDITGSIIVLTTSCPWKEHLFEYESANNLVGRFKYAVFPDEVNNDWRVQAVPLEIESFESRKPLPQAWRGVRSIELDRLLDLEGCVFVHASGFIGGHKTMEGAIKMAQLSLKSN